MLFDAETVTFLADLAEHNDKEWFDANRGRYDEHFVGAGRRVVAALAPVLAELSPELHAVPKVNGSMMRIHRDTRFSADKRPYKDHLDLMFWQGPGKSRQSPALMLRLTPTALHVGAGQHGFDKAQLATYREAVAGEAGEALVPLLEGLRADGYEVGGSHYKRVPRGYDAEHPRADLLRHAGLSAFWQGAPDQATLDSVAEHFRRLHPLVNWLDARLRG